MRFNLQEIQSIRFLVAYVCLVVVRLLSAALDWDVTRIPWRPYEWFYKDCNGLVPELLGGKLARLLGKKHPSAQIFQV